LSQNTVQDMNTQE